MKKLSVFLLIFILLCAVSCGTTKVNLGTTVEYEETEAVVTEALEPVDSADAFEGSDISLQALVESSEPENFESATSEVGGEEFVSESAGSEEVVSGELSESGETVDATEAVDLAEVVESTEVSDAIESATEGAISGDEIVSEEVSGDVLPGDEGSGEEGSYVEEVSEAVGEEVISAPEATTEELEVSGSDTSFDVNVDVNSTLSSESTEEVSSVVNEDVNASTEILDVSAPNNETKAKEVVLTNSKAEVPTAFLDKVVYYAKLYGSKALEFAKNNTLMAIGYLLIAIGVIWLFVDLIKFIVKSVRANNQVYDEFVEIEEPEISRSEVYPQAKKEAKAAQSENSKVRIDEDGNLEFKDEDEFLRSLLGSDKDL
jgi:hypothetical protein